MRPAVDGVLHSSEELVVEPRRLGPRARLVLVGVVALVCTFLLAGSQSAGCGSPPETSGSGLPDRPWLQADDPLVSDLHFGALDRVRSRADVAPEDVLSADVRRTTHLLGDTGGVAVYLADGPGFTCLGVDARPAHEEVAKECLLDTTIANQGLYALVRPDDATVVAAGPAQPGYATGAEDPVLVVAVPDHAQLLTAPATERVADYRSVVVLRPNGQEVLLQLGDQPPISVYSPAEATSFPGTC